MKFALLALVSVVLLYLLIDLFEELNYFTSRRAGLALVLLNYLYELPSAISLLYPVSLLLSVFVVYGQMVRYRELHALQSSGTPTLRLFAPALLLGLLSVLIYLAGTEYVTVPANRRLSDLRRYRIERRTAPAAGRRQDVYMAMGGMIVRAREAVGDTLLRELTLLELSPSRHVLRRTDGREASYAAGVWTVRDAAIREFDGAGVERLVRQAELSLPGLPLEPQEFAGAPRPIEETPAGVLRARIGRMKRAGENVAVEEVEFHYRFSYSLIGLVLILLGLPIALRIRKGGVMLGLGLGLLMSFLYWGAVQTSRAYGTSHILSPVLAAWLPNLLFGVAAVAFAAQVDR